MTRTDAFDKFALEYDDWFETHRVEYARELDAIRTLIPPRGRGVEIGAGTGRFSQPLKISLGVEPSAAMRNIAFRRGIKMTSGTAEALPIKDGVYDYALLVTTVCFLAKPEVAFKEAYRVLDDDGAIVVGLIDRDSRLGKKYEQTKTENKFYRDAHFHSVAAVRDALIKAGFGNLAYRQAILPGDADGDSAPAVREGYGQGSFVVLRAEKYLGH